MIYPDFTKCETNLIMQIIKDYPEYEYNIADYFYRAYMFPQKWGNTAGGFLESNSDFVPQAITEQSTLVLKCIICFKDYSMKAIYGVFFDGNPCYIVYEPTNEFFKDLRNMNMKYKGAARKAY